jgi:hypothetical protein
MDVNELVKAAKKTFGVTEVTADDIRRLKARISELRKAGLAEGDAAAQAATEIFSKGERKRELVEGEILKKSWDLSWFRTNSGEFLRAIDDYFKKKP